MKPHWHESTHAYISLRRWFLVVSQTGVIMTIFLKKKGDEEDLFFT